MLTRSRCLLLAVALGLAGLAPVHRAGASDCRPAAIVEGPAGITSPIEAILRNHGVKVGSASCPDRVVHVSLTTKPDSSSYVLHTEDAFGRKSQRQVKDASTAASLIESWVLEEDRDLLAVQPPPAATPPAQVVVRVAPIRLPPPAAPWRLLGALEFSGATDGSIWYGGSATVCGDIKGACVGGRVRIERDEGIAGPDIPGGDLTRTGVEVLAIAALPLSRGRFTFEPMVGVGAGWIHNTASNDVDSQSSVDFGLRLEAVTSAGLSITRHLALVGEVGVSWSPPTSLQPGSDASGSIVRSPAAYLRGAIGCQYTP